MGFLVGYRTYIIAGLLGVLAFVRYMGWIDELTYQGLNTLLLGGGFATSRGGVARVEHSLDQVEKRVQAVPALQAQTARVEARVEDIQHIVKS